MENLDITHLNLGDSKLRSALRMSLKEFAEIEFESAKRFVDIPLHLIPENYDGISLITVAFSSRNGFNEWAAYCGLPTPSLALYESQVEGKDLSNPQAIADYGYKLQEDTAKKLFPQFEQQGFTYRK